MASMLGHAKRTHSIGFAQLVQSPDILWDIPAGMDYCTAYLHRLREIDQAHSNQYIINSYVIDNLYSRLELATQQVSSIIVDELGAGQDAAQAAAEFRNCKVLETLEDGLNRIVARMSCGSVCPYDPETHEDLPYFTWQTDVMDMASLLFRCEQKWQPDVKLYEMTLLREHTNMFIAAMAQQERLIPNLIWHLSLHTVVGQLHLILKKYKVSKGTRTQICARVAGRKCCWTTEVPESWVYRPAKVTKYSSNPSCVVVEVPVQSNSSSSNSTVSDAGSGCRTSASSNISSSFDCVATVIVGNASSKTKQQPEAQSSAEFCSTNTSCDCFATDAISQAGSELTQQPEAPQSTRSCSTSNISKSLATVSESKAYSMSKHQPGAASSAQPSSSCRRSAACRFFVRLGKAVAVASVVAFGAVVSRRCNH